MTPGDNMRVRTNLATSVAAVAIAAVAAPATVSAQAAGDDADETIVVTARKKEETLVSAPVAVTAISAGDIERLQVNSVDDLARFTPGLSFSKAFGRSSDRPVLRGAANILATVQAGVESGTAFFVDGVYYQGDIQSLDPNEIQRIEVIKGPQSALYGRNTYAGAINYITRSPGDAFSATGKASFAENGEQNISFRIAGPLTDTFAASLSGRLYTYDGEWANSAVPGETLGAEESQSFALTAEWEPTDEFSVRARLSRAEDDDGPRAFGFQGSNQNNCYAGYRSNQFRGSPGTTNNNGFQYYCGVIRDSGVYFQNTQTVNPTFVSQALAPLPPTFTTFIPVTATWSGVAGSPFMGVAREVTNGSLIANLEIDSGHSFTVQAGFRDETRLTGSDSDFQSLGTFVAGRGQSLGPPSSFPVPNTRFPFAADGSLLNNGLFQLAGELAAQDWSLEVRVASPLDRRLRWLVGAYAYDLRQESTPLNWIFGAAAGYRGNVNVFDGVYNSAVFARVSFDVTDTVSLDVEARQQSEKKVTREFGDGTTNARPVGALLYEDARSFDAFTPRVTLSWQPSDTMTVYGIYSKGAKPGGLNGLIGLGNNRPTYEQEESTNYEIGFKGEFLDGRGFLGLAAYTTEADKYQLTTTIADLTGASATGLTSVVTNQGNAEIKGFEAEARLRITDNFRVAAGFSYVDATFTSGCDDFQYTLESGGFLMSPTCDVPVRTAPSVIPGGPVTPNAGASGSIVGNRIPLVPETQWTINADYNRPFGNGWEVFASADVSFEGSKFVQVHNAAETGDTTLVGARVGFGNETWQVSVFGRNLTDEDSIPIATRWFDLFQGSAASVGLTGSAATGIDTGSPRGFFFSPRRGRTLGAELKVSF
jgi:iron complex outermembrane recepter protein